MHSNVGIYFAVNKLDGLGWSWAWENLDFDSTDSPTTTGWILNSDVSIRSLAPADGLVHGGQATSPSYRYGGVLK